MYKYFASKKLRHIKMVEVNFRICIRILKCYVKLVVLYYVILLRILYYVIYVNVNVTLTNVKFVALR